MGGQTGRAACEYLPIFFNAILVASRASIGLLRSCAHSARLCDARAMSKQVGRTRVEGIHQAVKWRFRPFGERLGPVWALLMRLNSTTLILTCPDQKPYEVTQSFSAA
eukprot:2645412-Pleurochrysis_carterae.AAC.1